MHISTVVGVAAMAAGQAFAQQPGWAQCGGIGWTGGTTCVAGYTCVVNNDWYSQCIPGSASTSTTMHTSTSTATSKTTSVSSATLPTASSSYPWWFGVNLSGAEFGQDNFTGVYGREFIWYDKSAIDTLLSKGMNIFRVNFLMERLTPNSLTAALDPYYAGNLSDTVNYITSKGAYAIIQPHNYGRFYNNIITDTAGFQTWWKNVATPYATNPLVLFDTNNEYHDMDQQLVFNLNQAAINGIRAAGATTQYITPEGNSWTGAWTWVSSGNGASLINLNDPADSTGSKLIFQMHQYLDSDGSGSSDVCVSSTVFVDRLQAATQWLKDNNKKGLIGEYAGGANSLCIQALQGGLQYLKTNNDVWTGHLWWAAGPWWGTTEYSMEPPSGVAYTSILPSLLPYAK